MAIEAKENQDNNVDAELKDVAQVLYKQNAELAIKNKILSLLKKLYQLSILTLEPEVIAERVTDAIQKDLSFELVGIMVWHEEKKELAPLKFAESERFSSALKAEGITSFESSIITNPEGKDFFKVVLSSQMMSDMSGIDGIWDSAIPKESLKHLENNANIKASLIYPLIIGAKTTGVLIMCLNHDYNALSKFEKESIENFVNIISVALDRAFLYQELKAANIKLKELDELKSQFLSFASHQVKAPMAVVKGFAEIIRDGTYGAVPDKVKETAEKIIASANKLIDLVNNLLDMRKVEEGKMNYNFEEADLIKLTKEIVEELRPLAEKKKLDLSLDIKIDKAQIKVDLQKFKQTILNFVDNSIKYTPTGWVKVALGEDKNRPGNVLIEVSDSGLGISPELLPKLFQQFSRDKGETGKKILGTGLGLFIAKQIIKDHGGEIWVESEGEGKGSQFYISIKAV